MIQLMSVLLGAAIALGALPAPQKAKQKGKPDTSAEYYAQWLNKDAAYIITPEMVRRGQVIFSLSNPVPEVYPDDALAAGAAFAADGRSINNALAFPGLFRGALDVRSRAITPEMMVAAAEAIAARAEDGAVVPSPLDLEIHQTVRRAAAEKARAQGLAGTARLS